MLRSYVCCRVPGNRHVTIDGNINKECWQLAEWTADFDDILGPTAPRPWYRTRVKMLWDEEYLYIAASLEEPHVWATLTERDSVIFHDNDFEVFIDPDGDCHQYYEIEINALNTVWDLLLIKPYRNGGPAVNGWDLKGLKTAVHVSGSLNDASDHDQGWSVEMALPWAGLSECAHKTCPPGDGDEWRINFSRVEWHTTIENGKYTKVPGKPEENWVWSPQAAVDMHRPETWGRLVFSNHIADGKHHPAAINPGEEIRQLLMQVYHAQRAYYAVAGTYTESAPRLGIPESAVSAHHLQIHTMPGGFVATAAITLGTRTLRYEVREDSRLLQMT